MNNIFYTFSSFKFYQYLYDINTNKIPKYVIRDTCHENVSLNDRWIFYNTSPEIPLNDDVHWSSWY